MDKEKITSEEKKSECDESILEDEFNEDCVTAFSTNEDDDDNDDDANLITAASTMVSIACTAHCNNMSSYSCNIPSYILTSPGYDKLNEALEFPAIEHLDSIINKCSESASSRISDLSVSESVFHYRDTFMMKVNKYDDSNENLRTLTNTSPIVSEEEIIKMNLH